MKLNISNRRKVSLALIVSIILTICGVISTAGAESMAEPAIEPVVTADVQEIHEIIRLDYQQRVGVSAELAEAVLADQNKLLIDVMPALGIEDGINADVWVDDIDGGQDIHIRTQDEKIIAGMSEQTFAVSRVIIHQEPIMSKMAPDIDSDEVWGAIKSASPQVQGVYVRVQDGALVLHTMDNLSAADIEALKIKTGFNEIIVELTNEPMHDEV